MTTDKATPRTDDPETGYREHFAEHGHNRKLCRTLETELTERTEQLAEANRKIDALVTVKNESAAEVARLLALLEEIKGRVQFGVRMHMLSDVAKLCDAALKEGK